MRRPAAILLLFLSLTLVACVHSGSLGMTTSARNDAQVQPSLRETLTNLSEPVTAPSPQTVEDPVPLTPPVPPVRTPEQLESLANPVFSVTSVPSWGSEAAPDNGAMGIWTYNYYITHWWTPEGQAVLAMRPGQAFAIDGNAYLVEGVFDIDRSLDLADVYARVGRNWIFVQTCIPDTNPPYVRIIYAR